MKRLILTLMVIAGGLSMTALGISDNIVQAQNKGSTSAARRQQRVEQWHKDMAEFRQRSEQERQTQAFLDSIAGVQAGAALKNYDFVLEAESIMFKNGSTVFVNSATNFISLKGNRAVVQISPSNTAAGPNGLGGITVDGMATGISTRTDKKGRNTLSMNVMGVGINAMVEIYMTPGTNKANATIYPNFNSNTMWVSGSIVPYENSRVIEGNSL